VAGIAKVDMSPWSPGMDFTGFENDSHNVVTFSKSGDIEIFSSYPKWGYFQ